VWNLCEGDEEGVMCETSCRRCSERNLVIFATNVCEGPYLCVVGVWPLKKEKGSESNGIYPLRRKQDK
jgi:hypothetical protein